MSAHHDHHLFTDAIFALGGLEGTQESIIETASGLIGLDASLVSGLCGAGAKPETLDQAWAAVARLCRAKAQEFRDAGDASHAERWAALTSRVDRFIAAGRR